MVLYKHFPPARLDVLEGRTIRFTQPVAFNDPFEFKPSIESEVSLEYLKQNFDEILAREMQEFPVLGKSLSGNYIADLIRGSKPLLPVLIEMLGPELLLKVSNDITLLLNDNVGVLCLSEMRDSLLMWAHYPDNHQGFVIGFDLNHPSFSVRRGGEGEFGFLRKVKYCRSRPTVTLADTTSAEWFETKSDEWAYEKEWRMLRFLKDADNRLDAIPHPICLFNLPGDAIVELVAGLRSSEELRSRLRAASKGFPGAKLLQAHEDESEYALLFKAE